ncbi:MAG: hypothetical protein HY954_13155 [Deltaproteobacteria bacterium]|nr:hypothetical protein [Deltaproteobacteria bacterium]
MRNTIKVLEQIQKIDLEVKAIEEEEKVYLNKISEISLEIEAEKKIIDVLKLEAEDLKNLMKGSDEKIRESSERAGKDEKRLNDIKNDKELNALTKEINAANKVKKQNEQEKAVFNTKFEEKDSFLKAKEAAVNGKASELDGLNGELEAKRAGWKEEIDKRHKGRDLIKGELSPSILKKYEMIRSKRGGLGLAQVKNETCQGCYIHIPPQVYIQLKRGTDELMTCPHCHRILYVETQGQLEAV